MTTYYTLEQVKRANKAIGHHWFEPATLRFFSSRVNDPVIENMFVSSERFNSKSPRLYTIRKVNDDGSIDTVGAFQAYKSKTAALTAIFRMVNGDKP